MVKHQTTRKLAYTRYRWRSHHRICNVRRL